MTIHLYITGLVLDDSFLHTTMDAHRIF